MRILYGVVGEGMGHAIRSRVLIDHLTRSHEVQVVVSGRAHDYLYERVGPRLKVDRIWGLTIVYEDNQVRNFKTLLRNVKQAVTGGWPKNIRTYFRVAREFAPDVVITDFETWSYLFARNHLLPVISVDNMQVINRCRHPPELLAARRRDFELARAVVKMKVPGCYRYLITSFFQAMIRKARTSIHPPVLRPEILQADTEQGDHLLIYQTSESHTRLPEVLRQTGLECRVYGFRRDLSEEQVDGNLRYRPFSNQGFIDDLRTARAVVAGGGFTLMGEAVYLHKPMLAVPIRKQFEQVLNARYLEYEGYGMCTEELAAGSLGAFLERLEEYRANLASYHQDGNRDMLESLDQALAGAVRDGRPPADD